MINDGSTNRQYEINHATLSEAIELVIDYRGKTPKKLGEDWSTSGYRALSAKNIKTGSIVQPETIRYVDEELYKKWMKDEVQRGDIFITSEAPFGQIYYWDSDEKIVLSQRIFALRTKKEFCSKYLYYYMTTPEFQAELDARATGTTVIGLRQPELLKCKIKYPPLGVQRKIAGVLGALDDKIELNNQINNNLEQQAQALFKSWFVDFAPFGGKMPDDWKIGKLEDVVDVIMGQSPSGNSYNEKGRGCIFFQGRAEFGFRFPTIKLFTTEPRRMARQNDILMSVRAPVGDVNVAHEECCIGRGLCAIRSKDNFQSFILYTLWSIQNKLNIFNGEGTVFGSINKDSLNNLEIIVPNSNTIQKFENLCSPLDNLIRKNYEENTRLSALRDTLLPKLMSGEINIDKVEISNVKE